MGHSEKYGRVLQFYRTKKADGTRLWSKQMVKNAVGKHWITEEEYGEITGEAYKAV